MSHSEVWYEYISRIAHDTLAAAQRGCRKVRGRRYTTADLRDYLLKESEKYEGGIGRLAGFDAYELERGEELRMAVQAQLQRLVAAELGTDEFVVAAVAKHDWDRGWLTGWWVRRRPS